jgi:hypothetical protein
MLILPRFACWGYAAVKQRVDRFDRWPVWQRVRRGFQSPIYRIADTGLLGLTPLQKHILICGFPAAGTTLLQLMLETGLPKARRFGKERSGWKAATYSLRNHSILISKQPRDIFRLAPLREFYETHPAELRIILMQRDPRDLLTAERKRGGEIQYCASSKDWKGYYTYFLRERDSADSLVVKYEELVSDCMGEQRRIEAFVGEPMQMAFDKCTAKVREDFDVTTLCGVREVESSRVSRWRADVHRQRLAQMLKELPDLPEAVRQLGYETDDTWTADYV